MIVHNVLTTNWSILLLNLNHFFMHLTCCVIVSHLWFLSNNCGFIFRIIISAFFLRLIYTHFL